MKPFEIFRPGRHVAMTGEAIAFGAADLAASAEAYDKGLHEAPIVVGHPVHDAPAYGWVEGLDVVGGALCVTPAQVDPAFAEMVSAGRFKKVSASFYKPDAGANPAPGKFYLRHVGFLGGQPPAVKGLKPIQFAGGEDGTVTFGDPEDRTVARLFRNLREWLIEKFGAEDADKVLPSWDVDFVQEEAAMPEAADATSPAFTESHHPDQPTPEVSDMDKTELEAGRAALTAGEEKLAADRASFAERKTEVDEETRRLAREQAAMFVDGLVGEGQVPPGQKAALAAFMASLDDSETVEFTEGEDGQAKKLGQRAFFEAYLAALPKQIDFSERAAGGGNDPDATDPEAIANAAVAFQEEQRSKGITIGIDRAVRHVTQGA